jgi:hypothetical protein
MSPPPLEKPPPDSNGGPTLPPREKCGPLPLVLGVTGHRDLRAEDVPQLEATIGRVFQELHAKFPHTPLLLLSGLAEGADRLAAHVALECGARLVAPLPMPRAEYEKDFATAESRAEFAQLLGRAEEVIELTGPQGDWPASSPEDVQNRQYAVLGGYIARHSQILVALWDGVESTKVGGTRHVVQFKLEGVPEPFGPTQSPLDPVESGPVYHIMTPRRSQPQPQGEPFSLHKLYPASPEADRDADEAYTRVYQRMDGFNRDAVCHALPDSAAVEKSRDYVLSAQERGKLTHPERQLLDRYAVADALALCFRNGTKRTLRVMLIVIFVAAFLFNFVDLIPDAAGPVLSTERLLRMAYVLILAGGYLVYQRGRWNRFEDKYLDYRALAEGMRVQFFWRLGGIPAAVADHYLRIQRSELDWIRHAIRAWSTLTDSPTPGAPHADAGVLDRLRLVLTYWIADQRKFFTKTSGHDAGTHRRLKRWAFFFFAIGFLWALAKALGGSIHGQIWAWEAKLGTPLTIALQGLVLAVGLTPVIAALIHGYIKTSAVAEHAKQYGRMQVLFTNGSRTIEKLLTSSQATAAQELVLELGKEALTENATWVLIHRERPLPAPGL